MLKTLWNDESGVILSAEIVLVGTILVLGMIVGLVALQSAIVAELGDLATAFADLDQSYNTSGFSTSGTGHAAGVKARTAGANYADVNDDAFCDCNLAIICSDLGEKK